LLGPLISRVNALPVDLSRGDLTAVRAIINLLKEGHRTVIFPEGTRSRDGKIQPARAGIGMIIAKTLVPVVPMRIFGSFEAWPKGGKITPHRVTVVAGKPIRFAKRRFYREQPGNLPKDQRASPSDDRGHPETGLRGQKTERRTPNSGRRTAKTEDRTQNSEFEPQRRQALRLR